MTVLSTTDLRRKFGSNSTAREKYDTEFEKIRAKALKMKKGLSEDSPNRGIYEFSEYLRVREDELRELANELIKCELYKRWWIYWNLMQIAFYYNSFVLFK